MFDPEREGDAGRSAVPITPEEEIVCIDCGGRAFLLSRPRHGDSPDDPWLPGDIVAYRCEDCLDRCDLVLPEPGDGDAQSRRITGPRRSRLGEE